MSESVMNEQQQQMYNAAIELYSNYIKQQLIEDIQNQLKEQQTTNFLNPNAPKKSFSWYADKTDMQNLSYNASPETKAKIKSEIQYTMLKKLKNMDKEYLPEEGNTLEDYKEQLQFLESEEKFEIGYKDSYAEDTFEDNEELTKDFLEETHEIRNNIEQNILQIQNNILNNEQTNDQTNENKDELKLEIYKNSLLKTAQIMYTLEKLDQIEKYNEDIRKIKEPDKMMETLSKLRIDDGNMFMTNMEDLNALADYLEKQDLPMDYRTRELYKNFINSDVVKDYKDGVINHINKADIPKGVYDTIVDHYTKDDTPITFGYQKPEDYAVNPHAAIYINTNMKILKMLDENEKNPNLPTAKKANETTGEYIDRIKAIGQEIEHKEILQYERNKYPQLKQRTDEYILEGFYRNDKQSRLEYINRFEKFNSEAEKETDKIKLTKSYINGKILGYNEEKDIEYAKLREDRTYNPELKRSSYEKQRILDATMQHIQNKINILEVATDTAQEKQTKTQHTLQGEILLKSYKMIREELKSANIPEMLNKEYSMQSLLRDGWDINEAQEIQNNISNKAKMSQFNIQNGESINDYQKRIEQTILERTQINYQLQKQKEIIDDFNAIKIKQNAIKKYRNQTIYRKNTPVNLSNTEKDIIIRAYNDLEKRINNSTNDEEKKLLTGYKALIQPHVDKLQKEPDAPNPLSNEEITNTIETYKKLRHDLNKKYEELAKQTQETNQTENQNLQAQKEAELKNINTIQPIAGILFNHRTGRTGRTVQTNGEIGIIVKYENLQKQINDPYSQRISPQERQLLNRNIKEIEPIIQNLEQKIEDINNNEKRKDIVEDSVSKINDKLYDNLTASIKKEMARVQTESPEETIDNKIEKISQNLKNQTTINLNLVDEIHNEMNNHKGSIEEKLIETEKALNTKRNAKFDKMKKDLESIENDSIENKENAIKKLEANIKQQEKVLHQITIRLAKSANEKQINQMGLALKLPVSEHGYFQIKQNIERNQMLNDKILENIKESMSNNPDMTLDEALNTLDKKAIIDKTNHDFINNEKQKIEFTDNEKAEYYQKSSESNKEYLERITQDFQKVLKEKAITDKPEVTVSLMQEKEINEQLAKKVDFYVYPKGKAANAIIACCEATKFQEKAKISNISKMSLGEITKATLETISEKEPEVAEALRNEISSIVRTQRYYYQQNNITAQYEKTRTEQQNTKNEIKDEKPIEELKPENYYTLDKFLQDIKEEKYTEKEAKARMNEIIMENPRQIPIDMQFTQTTEQNQNTNIKELNTLAQNVSRTTANTYKWNIDKFHPELALYKTNYKNLKPKEDGSITVEDIEKVKKYQEAQQIIPRYGESLNKTKDLTQSDAFDNTGSDDNIDYRNGKAITTKERDQIDTEALINRDLNDTIKNPPLTQKEMEAITKILIKNQEVTEPFKNSIQKFKNYGIAKNASITEIRAIIDLQKQILSKNNISEKAELYRKAINENEQIAKTRKELLTTLKNAKRLYNDSMPTLQEYEIYEKLKMAKSLEGKSESTINTVNFIRDFNQRTGFTFTKYAQALDFKENEKNYKIVRDTKKWISAMEKIINTYEAEINGKRDIASNLKIAIDPEKQVDALKKLDATINERYKNIENLELKQYMGRQMTNDEKIKYKIWLNQKEKIQNDPEIKNEEERKAKLEEHIKNAPLNIEKITEVGSKLTGTNDSRLTTLIRRANTFLPDTPEYDGIKQNLIRKSQKLTINLEKSQEYAKALIDEYTKINNDKTSQNIMAMAKATRNRLYEACLPKVNQMATEIAQNMHKDQKEIRIEAFNMLMNELETRNFKNIKKYMNNSGYSKYQDGTLEGFITKRVNDDLINWSKNTDTGSKITENDRVLQETIKKAKVILIQNQKDNKTGAVIYNTNQEYGLNDYMTENEKIARIININKQIQNASRALKHMQDDGNIAILLKKANIDINDKNNKATIWKLNQFKIENQKELKSQKLKLDNYYRTLEQKEENIHQQITIAEKPNATTKDIEKLNQLKEDLAQFKEENKYVLQKYRNLKLNDKQVKGIAEDLTANPQKTIKNLITEHQYPVIGEIARTYQLKEDIKNTCHITNKTPYNEIEDKVNKYYKENKDKCKNMITKKRLLSACEELKKKKNAPGRFERIMHHIYNNNYKDIKDTINNASANAVTEIQNINTKIKNKGISGTNNAALSRIDKSKTSLDIIMKIDELAKIAETQKILLSKPIRKIDTNTLDYLESAKKVAQNNEAIAKYNSIVRELKNKLETKKIAIKPSYQKEGINPSDIAYSLKTMEMQNIPPHEYTIKKYDNIGATVEKTLTPKEAQELKADFLEEYEKIKKNTDEKGNPIVKSVQQYIYKLNEEVKKASMTEYRRNIKEENSNNWKNQKEFRDITVEEIETNNKNVRQATFESLSQSVSKANYNKNSDGNDETELQDTIADKNSKSMEERDEEDLHITALERQKYTLKKVMNELNDEDKRICDIYTNKPEYNTKKERAAMVLNKDAKEITDQESLQAEKHYNEIKETIRNKMQAYTSEEVINEMPKPLRKALNIYGHEANQDLNDIQKAAKYLDKKQKDITPKDIAYAESKYDKAEQYYKEQMANLGYKVNTEVKPATYEDAIAQLKESDQKIMGVINEKFKKEEDKAAFILEKDKNELTREDRLDYERCVRYAKAKVRKIMFINDAAVTLANMPKQLQKAYKLYNDKNNETLTDKEKASIYYGIKEKEITPNDINRLQERAKRAEKALEQIMVNKGHESKEVYANATRIAQTAKKLAINTEIKNTVSQHEQEEIKERTMKGAFKKGLRDVRRECENFLSKGKHVQEMVKIMETISLERTKAKINKQMENMKDNVKQNMQPQNAIHAI